MRRATQSAQGIREDINEKKTFSFGHCPNHLTPVPPIRATWSPFFGRQKQRFAHMTEKDTIQMMMMMVEMIIMMVMMIILMKLMTKMTKNI